MKDKVFRAAVKARKAAGKRRALFLAQQSQSHLFDTARRHNLDPATWPSQVELIDAIVGIEFPPLVDSKPNQAANSVPIRQHDGQLMQVQVSDDPEGVFNYLDQTKSHAARFAPQVRQDADKLVGMMAQAKDGAFAWPGKAPTVDGGVNVLDVLKGQTERWWLERFFVAFDHGTQGIKLEVKEIKTLNGYGGDSREEHRVVMVEIPGWWLEVDYVEGFVGELEQAALTGEPENVLRVLDRVKQEQGWTWDATAADVANQFNAEQGVASPTWNGDTIATEATPIGDTVGLPAPGSPEFEAQVQRNQEERQQFFHPPVTEEQPHQNES